MPINLTNREDIICNSLKIVTNSQTINIEEKLNNTYDKTTVNNMLSNVVGLPPATLNSLEKVSTALDNDPTFFTTINTKLDAKAPILTTSTKTELSDAVSTINTSIGNKQNKFLIAETIPTNTARLFDSGNTKFRALNVNAPLSITTPNYDYLSLSCDAYDKTNIDGKITTINNTLETKATTTTVNTKQDKLVLGTSITGSQSLFNTTTSKLKNIVGANLTLTSDVDNLTITGIDAYDKTNIDGKITTINNNISAKRNTSDSYTKTEVDQKISDLVGTAPALLNTLQEISTSLNNDPSFNTTVVNSLSTKANTTDTFLKQTINSNDISLSGLGNYRHVSYAQNINDFKYSLEYYDNIATGRVPNYLWNNIFNVVWDAVSATSKMYIPNSLYINNIDVLTTLNAKANTSSLSSYATTSSLSSYALTANTFSKSTVSNDVYLTLDNNKRIVGTSTANQFKFQILDNQGASFTDAWIDVGIIDFNITTKKAKFTIKDSLFIDSTDVLTTLNAKANTSSLSSYATTSSLSSYATTSSLSSYATTSSLSSYATTSSLSSYALTSALTSYALLTGATYTGTVTGPTINSTNSTITTLLTTPQIMFTSNSNPPALTTRSIGTKLVLFPSITGSRADYAIGLETDNMWFSIADNFASTGFKWYGATNNIMTLGGTGNLTCSGGVTCSSVTVGSTNIVNELNNKLSNTSTLLTNSAVAWSSGLATDAYHYITTGTDSLFIKSATQNSVAFFGDMAGAASGNALFYKNVEIVGSLKLGSITNVATELNNKLSTTSTLLTSTAVAWSSGNSVGYNTINGGTDALCIQTNSGMAAFNVLGSVAGTQEGYTLFYKKVSMPHLDVEGVLNLGLGTNKKAITTLFDEKAPVANPSFTGSVTADSLITNNILPKTGSTTTVTGSLAITNLLKLSNYITFTGTLPSDGVFICKANGVELFCVNSMYTRSVENIVGLKNIEALGMLTVGGIANFTGDITLANTTTGTGGSVQHRITNNGDGYACQFINSTYSNEEGQIWIGRGYGFNIRTNTESPISFQTGGYTTPISMSILGSGNRDVEIYTPLKIKGSSTTIDQSVTIGGNLTVTGNLSTSSFFVNKPWVSVKQTTGTSTVTYLTSYNQANVTFSNGTVGTYVFTMPNHPQGTNYTVSIQQIASASTTTLAFYNVIINSSTQFTIYSKTTASAAVASNFSVYTVP